MNAFHLSIVSPEREAYGQDVESVSVPGLDGRLMILPHHAKLFAALTEGIVKIVKEGQESFLAIGGGFIDVSPEEVSLLVSRAVHGHELNEEAIKHAVREAGELVAKAKTNQDRASALSLLRRSTIEDRLLSRIRHKTRV